MKTKPRNTGTNDGSGRWLFESFIVDERTGCFVVEFTPKWTYMKHDPEHPHLWDFEALRPYVVRDESVLFDEFGTRIISPVGGWESIEKQILEAFEDQLEDVEIAEREYR